MENYDEQAFKALVQEHKSQSQDKALTAFMNHVANHLHVELLYGDYPNESDKVFAVRFQSKLGDGQATVTYLGSDLNLKQKDVQNKLNQIAAISIREYRVILDYVDYLKRHNMYTPVPNIYATMNPSALYEEGLALYQKVSENILSHLDRYPSLRSGGFQTTDPGVIPDSATYEQEFGSNVVAVTKNHLLHLLDWENSTVSHRLESIVRAWIDMGYALRRDKPAGTRKNRSDKKKSSEKPRLQLPISPIPSLRFYVIKIKGIRKIVEGCTDNE